MSDKMNRGELITAIKEKINIETNRLTLCKLCSCTEFDSFATVLSFGMRWNEHGDDMETMPESTLRMALYNLTLFPKTKENSDD